MSLNFTSHDCTIQDTHTLKMIGKPELIDGLYVLDAISGVRDFRIPKTIIVHVSKTTWHKRLECLSFKRLDSIKPQLQFNNTDKDFYFAYPWLDKGDCLLYLIIINHRMLLI